MPEKQPYFLQNQELRTRISRITRMSMDGRKRPTCTRVWTAQKGKHVTVSAKITKEEYERFSAVVKANKTNKNEVLRMFIRSYINNVK